MVGRGSGAAGTLLLGEGASDINWSAGCSLSIVTRENTQGGPMEAMGCREDVAVLSRLCNVAMALFIRIYIGL
jgi:hypothetical protein